MTHRSPPDPAIELIITTPRPEDALRIAARLLSTKIPFALLLPSDLAPRIADDDQFDAQPCLRALYKHGGKIMFLDSDFLWFIGSIPELADFAQIFSHVLDRPPPTARISRRYPRHLPPLVPTRLESRTTRRPRLPRHRRPRLPRCLQWSPRLSRSRFPLSHCGSHSPSRTSHAPTPRRPTPPRPRQGAYLSRPTLLLALHARRHSSLARGLR